MAHPSERLKWTVQDTASDRFARGCDVTLATIDLLRHLPGRRSVWRANSPGDDILLKAYDLHAKQERDVDREWRLATQLAAAKINVARPLFRASTSDGRIAVAFEFIPDGQPLNEVITEETLQRLFRLVAAQHEAGFYQTDNHLGNYLWSARGLTMLDAGSCRTGTRPLSRETRVRNLAILIATIPLGFHQTVDKALSAYTDQSKEKNIDAFRASLDLATADARKTRLKRYLKKTRRSCTEFVAETDSQGSWLARRDLHPELASKLRETPNQFFDQMPLLKDGNTCTVVEILHENTAYVLKRYNRKPFGYRAAHAFATPRALSSWSHGHALRSFGVPTPCPLACLLVKQGPLLNQAFLLMEKAEGESLHETNHPEAVANEFANRVKELEILQATHGDMKASNFIITEDGTLTLIDLDSFHFHQSSKTFRKQMLKDRKRFLKNWQTRPACQEAFLNALA